MLMLLKYLFACQLFYQYVAAAVMAYLQYHAVAAYTHIHRQRCFEASKDGKQKCKFIRRRNNEFVQSVLFMPFVSLSELFDNKNDDYSYSVLLCMLT